MKSYRISPREWLSAFSTAENRLCRTIVRRRDDFRRFCIFFISPRFDASGILTDSCLKFDVFAFSAPDFAARRTIVRLARRNRTLQTILSPRLRDSEKHKAKKLECTWNWFKVRRIMWKKLRTCMPPPCRGISAHWAAQRLNQRRGCWKLKNPLSNFARDEFSVTPEIAITIKIDVTEKLSRK